MYTQCPECSVAFRVTAEVLKMAAGKVRCGGCGVAFNALEHLSETKPVAPPPTDDPIDPDLPELQPEEPGELEADTPPESISAEQSAALLKTLDQLAGEDIRIEDTGAEWRVIDDSAEDPETVEDDDSPDETADTGSLKFLMDEEAEPDETDTPEPHADEPLRVIDEMRFDDNTVLPDDFDEVVEAPSQPKVEEPPPPPPEPEQPQFDLDLSEPDEWDDLLGDLEEQLEAVREGGPLDVDTQFEIQAEAMGIDLSGIHDVAEAQPLDDEPEGQAEPEPEADLEAEAESEPGEEPEEEPQEEAEEEPDEVADEELEDEPEEAAEEEPEEEPEEATGTEDQPEAEDEPEPAPEPETEAASADDEETSIDDDLIAAAFETEAAAKASEGAAPDDTASEDEEADEEYEDLDLPVDLQDEDEAEIEADVEDIAMGFDDDVERDIETLSMSLDDEETEDRVATRDEDHVVPEMSEEEKTINMMIDQELFNIAVEDEEGFASTIVQLQPDEEIDEEADEDEPAASSKKKDKKKKKDKGPDERGGGADVAVETIIMEGDFVRGELDRERLANEAAASSGVAESPGVAIPINREKDDYARRSETAAVPAGVGTWAGIAALVLLLGVQFIHQSREALATVPAFNSAVGPVYRMLGQPLTPQWNVGGWRFEATKGDTDETGEQLTIYSRIGNNSGEALPYPLVHLSLTDRFEDIIGSAVLEPAEYLPEDADPRKPVPPGSSFNAVVSIASPSPDATGFKLNVCYRIGGGQLRCADHDFK